MGWSLRRLFSKSPSQALLGTSSRIKEERSPLLVPPTSGSLARNAEVISQRSGAETLLFSLDSGQYFSLNDLGGKVWNLTDGTRSPQEIAAILEGEYDAPYETILGDVVSLIDELVASGLLFRSAT